VREARFGWPAARERTTGVLDSYADASQDGFVAPKPLKGDPNPAPQDDRVRPTGRFLS
jgi:hypothetical protein